MRDKKNPIHKKIKFAMIESGLNQTQLAKKIGITRQSLSEWLSSCENPKLENIRKIAEATEKPLEYFLEEINTQNTQQTTDEYTTTLQAVPLNDKNTIQLPILADVPAGLPEFSDRDVEMFVDIPRFIFPGADFVVKCIGDSLEPKIHKGDFCVIRKMQEPIDGRAMLVKTENGICMKVIKKVKNGLPQLCSTNPKYKPFTTKELSIIGLIIGHWSRDDKENWN